MSQATSYEQLMLELVNRERAKTGAQPLAFNGNRLAWLSRTGPTYGSARVYIDGSLVKTVNLNAATVTDRKMVFVRSWSAIGNHTIRIVVVGTSGHPGVVLDQIFVLR